jgi:hypothetical protein
MAVRSIRLGAGLVNGSATVTAYTCPAGFRTIIKCLSAWNVDSAFNRLYGEITSGATVLGYLQVPLGAEGTLDEAQHVEMFQVMNAGEELIMDALHASIYFVVSGAELAL